MDLQRNEDGSSGQQESQSNSKDPKGLALINQFSHDLRVRLNSMIGFANLVKESELSATDRKAFADKIIANGDQLLQMINDLQAYAKSSRDDIPVDCVRFNLSSMVFDIAHALKSTAQKNELDVLINFQSPIPEVINSDPLKIHQILTNVISFMIENASGSGFVLARIGFSKETNQVQIQVDDSGAGGIPFKYENQPALLLSQEFARILGGKLEFHPSRLGSGNSIEFSIPAGDIKDVAFIEKEKTPSLKDKIVAKFKKSKRLEGVRVLLAEDSEDNSTIIRLYLAKEGAQISFARNGLEALEFVRSQEYDIVLMDIQMPLMDGLEATRELRRRGFRRPIIALTGQALRDDAENSLKAGCDSHLSKPVKQEPLIEEIKRLLSH